MENKKWFLLPIMIFNVLAVIFCIGGSIYIITSYVADVYIRIASSATLLALISALYYIYMGYKKSAANAFKIFIYLCAFSDFMIMIFAASFEEAGRSVGGVACNAILFALILALALSKDLGKVKSLTICGFIFGIRLIMFLLEIVSEPVINEIGTLYVLLSASSLVLGSVVGVMTYMKYIDKEKRKAQNQ